METARDAWQATQELKQLFGGMEPGMGQARLSRTWTPSVHPTHSSCD